MRFLLKCPSCGNSMQYQTSGTYLDGKRKQCVYCGKGFLVREHIVKKL
ncbi:hypothetical protein J4460_06945 [Candidatus Woesearchaeota archaeon]|nr:hypothetical protein [Candidatus Woesearchaeota archaeon]HIH38242.1 hypothetical protein [Candidatus Woesearchaeota archaeon]HIH49089.1 hypothetical protein [Candidatus Woesearchaeota archaeon]HIJ04172.1 hypothetical protein [Candidatus Woesearchaeota archaeon]